MTLLVVGIGIFVLLVALVWADTNDSDDYL